MALEEVAEETQQDFPSKYHAGRAAPKSSNKPVSPELRQALIESKRTSSLTGIISELKREFGGHYDYRAQLRTRRWLEGDLEGSTRDARTPYFWTGTKENKSWASREFIEQQFVNKVGSHQLRLPPDYVRLISDLERSQQGKTGALSVFLPWPKDGPEKVARVYCDKPITARVNLAHLRVAIKMVEEILSGGKYTRVATVDEAIGAERTASSFSSDEGMDRSTNSGLPYNKHRWIGSAAVQQGDDLTDSNRAYSYIRMRVSTALERFASGKTITWWAMAAKRLNVPYNPEDWEKHKRIVIALEKAEPIIARMFTSVFLPKLKRARWRGTRTFVALQDMPAIDLEMQNALSAAHQHGYTLVGGDFSAYDASLPPWLIKIAGQCLASMNPAAATVIMASVESFADKVNLVTANKIWHATPSSVKSGSGWTNIIDSVCNLLVHCYGEASGAFKIEGLCVQGDDFIIWGPDVTPATVSSVSEDFGLTAHPTKQWYEEDSVVFLQKLHLRGMLGGIASCTRTLLQTLSYERMKYSDKEWSLYTDAVRTRAQLENAAFSPYFQILVDYMKSGSSIALGAGLPVGELVKRAGTPAEEALMDNYALSQKWSGESDLVEALKVGAVSGVLAGEQLPPVGSKALFSRVYGSRASELITG